MVADEFVTELRRTSKGGNAPDPILQMAFQLPRLPRIDPTELDTMTIRIHDLVFVRRQAKGASSIQAVSDARHLAHAAMSRAAAFVTSDGSILAARSDLLSTIGVDVVSLEELIALLPPEVYNHDVAPIQGADFRSATISKAQLSEYLTDVKVDHSLISEFCSDDSKSTAVRRIAILEDSRLFGAGVLNISKSMEPVARVLIHVRPEHADCDIFADHILDALVRAACKDGPISLELVHLAGQPSVNSFAKMRGFFRKGNNATYSKVAIGCPLTLNNWLSIGQSVRRRTGLILPDHALQNLSGQHELDVRTSTGQSVRLSLSKLEDMLSPTIFIWSGRNGVIVPITRAYADDLLGTSRQSRFAFIVNRDAAFLSRRGYVNSPRASRQMRPDSPILFYESKGDGDGQGAVVAVARIVNSMIIRKSEMPKDEHRRLVVDSVDQFSASDDVLFTTFDNLFVVPQPVPFHKLREMDAVGGANLISAASLSSEKITAILTQGWCSGETQ